MTAARMTATQVTAARMTGAPVRAARLQDSRYIAAPRRAVPGLSSRGYREQ
jgi:hypothetical protein